MPSLTIQVGSSCVCKQDRQEQSVPSLGIHSRCSAARWCVRRTGSGAGRFLLRAHPTASAPAHTSAHVSHLRCLGSPNNMVFVLIDAERCNLFFSYSFSSQICQGTLSLLHWHILKHSALSSHTCLIPVKPLSCRQEEQRSCGVECGVLQNEQTSCSVDYEYCKTSKQAAVLSMKC